MKTLPRPKGKATEVIYTVYELPRPDASPHDTVFDAQGNLWYSDFNSQFIGKLDLKTGKVVDYVVPQSRGFQTAQGGLQIDVDKEGRLYFGNMFQMALARFDPKTEKFDVHKLTSRSRRSAMAIYDDRPCVFTRRRETVGERRVRHRHGRRNLARGPG